MRQHPNGVVTAAAGPADWETVQDALGWAKQQAKGGFRHMDNTAVGLANGAVMTVTNAAPAMSYLASSVAR